MTRADHQTLEALVALLRGRRVAVLSGAGISTESGIPDYRGPENRHKLRRPIQHQEFVHQPHFRQRYWARSAIGWPRLRAACPNAGHRALAALESAGVVSGLLTQNVDGLHQEAGSHRVIELHGALSRVRCLACAALSSRDALQERLLALNPRHAAARPLGPLAEAESAPDGDAELSAEATARFRVPPCAVCGGVLMPDVVFFGGTVPRPRVAEARSWVSEADALLVVGSSLTVFSGFRFVREAHRRAQPVGILNLGETRGDPLATVRVHARCGAALPALVRALVPALSPDVTDCTEEVKG